MLSRKYITDKLSRHWSVNKSGLCSTPGCTGEDVGSLEHMLLFCPALADARQRIIALCHKVALENEDLTNILSSALNGQTTEMVMQFLLDCSSLPAVIILKQSGGNHLVERLFYISRSWCYSLHRSRMNKLGLFQYR